MFDLDDRVRVRQSQCNVELLLETNLTSFETARFFLTRDSVFSSFVRLGAELAQCRQPRAGAAFFTRKPGHDESREQAPGADTRALRNILKMI